MLSHAYDIMMAAVLFWVPWQILDYLKGKVMDFKEAHSIRELLGMMVGAGSMCWEKSGIFDSETATQVIDGGMKRLYELAAHGVIDMPPAADERWEEIRSGYSGTVVYGSHNNANREPNREWVIARYKHENTGCTDTCNAMEDSLYHFLHSFEAPSNKPIPVKDNPQA